MIRTLFSLALLASLAGAEVLREEWGPDPLARAQARAVDDYLATVDLEEFTLPRPVLAPATGGLAGLFIPALYAWFPTIDGTVSTDGNPDFDLQDDFGLTDTEASGVVEAQFSLGGLGVRFSAFFLEFEGSNILNRSITFGNVTFIVAEQVDSVLEINNYKLVTFFPIVKTQSLAISLQAGISYYQLNGRARSQSGLSATETGDLPVPVGGILVHARAGRFIFEADVAGLTIDYGDSHADLLEVQVSVGMTFLKIFGLKAGYRHIVLDARANNFTIDATLEGFFVGAALLF